MTFLGPVSRIAYGSEYRYGAEENTIDLDSLYSKQTQPARAGCRRRIRTSRRMRGWPIITAPARAARARAARDGRVPARAEPPPSGPAPWGCLQRHDSAGDASGLVRVQLREGRRQSNTRTCLAVISHVRVKEVK